MTKKDYIKIAEVFKTLHRILDDAHEDSSAEGENGGRETWWSLQQGISRILSEDNPHYDYDKFATACGL